LSNTVFCQDKLPAEYLQAQKLYGDRKFEAALPLFKKSISQLNKADNVADVAGLKLNYGTELYIFSALISAELFSLYSRYANTV